MDIAYLLDDHLFLMLSLLSISQRLMTRVCFFLYFSGYRSSYRDLESQVVVVTHNRALRHALTDERRKLYLHATPVDGSTFARPDRFVPRWVRLVSRLIRHFF